MKITRNENKFFNRSILKTLRWDSYVAFYFFYERIIPYFSTKSIHTNFGGTFQKHCGRHPRDVKFIESIELPCERTPAVVKLDRFAGLGVHIIYWSSGPEYGQVAFAVSSVSVRDLQ